MRWILGQPLTLVLTSVIFFSIKLTNSADGGWRHRVMRWILGQALTLVLTSVIFFSIKFANSASGLYFFGFFIIFFLFLIGFLGLLQRLQNICEILPHVKQTTFTIKIKMLWWHDRIFVMHARLEQLEHYKYILSTMGWISEERQARISKLCLVVVVLAKVCVTDDTVQISCSMIKVLQFQKNHHLRRQSCD